MIVTGDVRLAIGGVEIAPTDWSKIDEARDDGPIPHTISGTIARTTDDGAFDRFIEFATRPRMIQASFRVGPDQSPMFSAWTLKGLRRKFRKWHRVVREQERRDAAPMYT